MDVRKSLLALGLLGMQASASAIVAVPAIWLDGQELLSGGWTNTTTVDGPVTTVDFDPFILGDWNVSFLSVSWDIDPVINVAFDVVDVSGTGATFSLSVIAPIAPVATGLQAVDLSAFLGATDAGVDGVSATPTAGVFGADPDGDTVVEAQVVSVSSDGGATWSNLDENLGAVDTVADPAVVFIYETATGTASASGWDTWRIDLNFKGSGGDDAYSYTGRAEIVSAVPLPAAAWLFGSALAGFAALRRRAA